MTARPQGAIGSEVKAIGAVVGATSVTRGTLLTPTSGTAVQILGAEIVSFVLTTDPGRCEIYFGTGANILTTPANWIFAGSPTITGTASIWFGESGPTGAVDTVVSMRTNTETELLLNFAIWYREI